MWREAVVHGVWLSALALGCDADESKPVVLVSRSEISYEGRLVQTSETGLSTDGKPVYTKVITKEMSYGPLRRLRVDDHYVPRYIIRHNCSRNGAPVRNLTFDLAAKTQELIAYDSGAQVRPVVTPLTDKRVASINQAVLDALEASPSTPEASGPDGLACTLSITEMGRSLLVLDKADMKENDWASALVKLLLAAGD